MSSNTPSWGAHDPESALRAAHGKKDGLTFAEARIRLARDGANQLQAREVRPIEVFVRQFRSVFVYLLIVVSVVSFAMGDIVEGTLIFGFVLLNSLLGFAQEYQSERALALLKRLAPTWVRVRRDGDEQRIKSEDLVVGDVVLLRAGDLIPADVRFLETQECTVDESILTGESLAAEKSAHVLTVSGENADTTGLGFSGTTVLTGQAMAVVVATGSRTEVGKIGTLAAETGRVSVFEKGIAQFSAFILRLIVITLGVVFLAQVALKGSDADIPALLIFSIALAVSVVPEALPIVTTISLSRGAMRLAKAHVVVKRLSAIEDLGSIDILCTDKTGTLTQNAMTVVDVYGGEHSVIVSAAALAATPPEGNVRLDPFDTAVWKALDKRSRRAVEHTERIAEIPFDPTRRRNSVLCRDAHHTLLIVRGAPESLLACCVEVSPEEQAAILAWVESESARGRRVLAIAEKRVPSTATLTIHEERGLALIGLIAFEDPLKATAKHTLARAHRLGVQVKILTGDHPTVAAAIAKEVGLIRTTQEVMTGAQLEALSQPEQRHAVMTHAVFARVSPEQKYRIIQLLQAQGKDVGFLGEGINDAPALKIANMGMVVANASDVAREAADILLLRRSLETIIDGIEEGRRVFVNTTTYIQATLASNFGNFFAVATASLLMDALPMLPIQLLLLNLLSDFPMIALSTDHVDSAELRRPRHAQVRDVVMFALVLGVVSTVFDFIFFAVFRGLPVAELRTNWFIGSVLTELVFLFSVRTKLWAFLAKPPSRTLVLLSGCAGFLAVFLPFSPWGQALFGFVSPIKTLPMILGIVVAFFCVSEVAKQLYVRWIGNGALPTQEKTPA